MVYSTLSLSPLFKGMSEEEICSILSQIEYEILDYSRGSIIYSPDHYSNKVGFILEGECDVLQEHSNGNDVSLNSLSPGNAFGILNVFSIGETFPTTIRAKRQTKILFLKCDDFRSIIESNPKLSSNSLEFLAARIRFLNERIATFSGSGADQKVARYLLSKLPSGADIIEDFNKQSATKSIGIGRASLYRILNKFADSDLIELSGKNIIIKKINEIERISK